jgi:protein phosphatase
MVIVESAGMTDVGKKRKGNEDALFLDDAMGLYIVADGMGGHQAGEVASRLVVEGIRDYMKRFTDDVAVEELADPDDTLSKEANRLLSSIHLANWSVNQLSYSKRSYEGMGSTVSAVYFTADTIIAANVGDSPIYLVHDSSIEALYKPHTVRAEQAALNPGGLIQPQFAHMLTRAMGVDKTVEPYITEIQCFEGDVLVIGSDGLSDKVSPEEVLEIVARERPEKACRLLVDAANERGGDDNITVVVVKVKAINGQKAGIAGFFRRLLSKLLRVKL